MPTGILRNEHQEIQEVRVSAKSAAGIDSLLEAIAELVAGDRIVAQITIPPSLGKLRGLLFHLEAIREESYLEDGSLELSINISSSDWQRLKQTLKLNLDQYIDSK
ncbi:MAG: GTP-binding protein HflX [Enterobacterales bacterium]